MLLMRSSFQVFNKEVCRWYFKLVCSCGYFALSFGIFEWFRFILQYYFAIISFSNNFYMKYAFSLVFSTKANS